MNRNRCTASVLTNLPPKPINLKQTHNANKDMHAMAGRKKKHFCKVNAIRIIRSTSKSRTPIGALCGRTTDPSLSPPPKEILVPIPTMRHQPRTRTSPENDVKAPNPRRPRPHGRDVRNASSHHRMHANLMLPAAAAAAATESPCATPPAEPIRPATGTAKARPPA